VEGGLSGAGIGSCLRTAGGRGWRRCEEEKEKKKKKRKKSSAQKRKKPPFKPAGIRVLKKHVLKRYAKFEYVFPSYQFQDKYMVISPKGEMGPPTAEMREILMGFPRDYTHPVMTASERRKSEEDFDLARCSLLGNTFHAGVVAWLVSRVLHQWGILSRPATVAEIADPGVPAALGTEISGAEMDEVMANQECRWSDCTSHVSRTEGEKSRG